MAELNLYSLSKSLKNSIDCFRHKNQPTIFEINCFMGTKRLINIYNEGNTQKKCTLSNCRLQFLQTKIAKLPPKRQGTENLRFQNFTFS